MLIRLTGQYGSKLSNHKVEQIAYNDTPTFPTLFLVNEISSTVRMNSCLHLVLSVKLVLAYVNRHWRRVPRTPHSGTTGSSNYSTQPSATCNSPHIGRNIALKSQEQNLSWSCYISVTVASNDYFIKCHYQLLEPENMKVTWKYLINNHIWEAGAWWFLQFLPDKLPNLLFVEMLISLLKCKPQGKKMASLLCSKAE